MLLAWPFKLALKLRMVVLSVCLYSLQLVVQSHANDKVENVGVELLERLMRLVMTFQYALFINYSGTQK